jgi:hypothetical protein
MRMPAYAAHSRTDQRRLFTCPASQANNAGRSQHCDRGGPNWGTNSSLSKGQRAQRAGRGIDGLADCQMAPVS